MTLTSIWPFCLGENGFASSKEAYGNEYEQAKVWEAAAQLGFDGIELHPLYHPLPAPEAKLIALRRRIEDMGLRVAGTQTSGPSPCFGQAQADAYAEMLSGAIEAAVVLGTHVVGCWPGPSLPDMPDAEKVERVADTLRRVTPEAERAGVVIAMEPEPVQVADSIPLAMGILNAVGSPAFAFIFDIAHATVLGEGDPLTALAVMGPHIGHVHFTDSDGSCRTLPDGSVQSSTHLAPGEGNVDLGAVLSGLRLANYQGWIQADVWQHPEPFMAARKSIEFLRAWSEDNG